METTSRVIGTSRVEEPREVASPPGGMWGKMQGYTVSWPVAGDAGVARGATGSLIP